MEIYRVNLSIQSEFMKIRTKKTSYLDTFRVVPSLQNHHLIKKHQILYLNKLDSKELYNLQFLTNFLKPTSQAYFENVFAGIIFEWNKIYILPRIVPTDSRIRIFQYKIFTQYFIPKQKAIPI